MVHDGETVGTRNITIGKLHPIDTVESNGSSIFVVAGTTLARIEKLSGLVTWKKGLPEAGTSDSDMGVPTTSWTWQIKVFTDRLLVTHVENEISSATALSSTLTCLRVADGAVLWSRHIDVPIASVLLCAGNNALVPLETGEVLSLDLRSNAVVWRRQVSSTHYARGRKERCPALVLSCSPGACIARAGDSHLLGLNAATGDVLWSKTLGSSIADAEKRAAETRFKLDKGVVYISPTSVEILAWNAVTGTVVWDSKFKQKPSWDDSGVYIAPMVGRDIVVAQNQSGLTGVRRTDGTPVWTGCSDKPGAVRSPRRSAFTRNAPTFRNYLRRVVPVACWKHGKGVCSECDCNGRFR